MARKRDEQAAERAVGHVIAALGYDPVLAELKHQDALDAVDQMLKVIPKPAAVDK